MRRGKIKRRWQSEIGRVHSNGERRVFDAGRSVKRYRDLGRALAAALRRRRERDGRALREGHVRIRRREGERTLIAVVRSLINQGDGQVSAFAIIEYAIRIAGGDVIRERDTRKFHLDEFPDAAAVGRDPSRASIWR